MDKGHIQQIGLAKDLLLHPANTFVQQFFNHNRFQLERMVQTLEDILPTLVLKKAPDTPVTHIFDSKRNVWEVLNWLQENKQGNQWFGIRNEGVVTYTTFNDMLGHIY
jgi:osmoprotectant transport system ATP-binding protein